MSNWKDPTEAPIWKTVIVKVTHPLKTKSNRTRVTTAILTEDGWWDGGCRGMLFAERENPVVGWQHLPNEDD